jgi:hypothetical protein
MSKTTRIPITVAILIAAVLTIPACEQSEPPPATQPATQTTSQPTQDELANLRDYARQNAPQQTAQRLPAGHPPTGQPGAQPPAAPSRMPPPPAANLTYTAPKTWQQEPVRSSMRKAQFRLPRAEGDTEDGLLTVFYFGPGGGGGVEANVDRWRNQFVGPGNGPVPDDDFTREEMEANGLKITVVEVHGRFAPGAMGAAEPPPARDEYHMLAAIVDTPAGPWYFKAIGPQETMQQHRPAFMEFLQTMSTE